MTGGPAEKKIYDALKSGWISGIHTGLSESVSSESPNLEAQAGSLPVTCSNLTSFLKYAARNAWNLVLL